MVHVNVHQPENGFGQDRSAVSFPNLKTIHIRISLCCQDQIKRYNESFIIDQEYDSTLQLICNNSICVCQGSRSYGNWVWNGTQCGLKINKQFFEEK
jgi:hypothetical protein